MNSIHKSDDDIQAAYLTEYARRQEERKITRKYHRYAIAMYCRMIASHIKLYIKGMVKA